MNVLPSPLLAPYVKYYWVVKADETTAIQTVPSGCIHLVFHRGGSMYFSDGEQQPQSFIRGQLSDPGVLGCRTKVRHFNREFSKYIGTSPKEYLRIVRFQRLLHLLQNNPGTELTELAYGCGFCDSSHLVKEFRSLTGCTPTEYLQSRKPHSTFFSKGSKLNIIKLHR